jgi:hypothetical protein
MRVLLFPHIPAFQIAYFGIRVLGQDNFITLAPI